MTRGELEQREYDCYSSCQGVPDDALEGRAMAKAWLFAKLFEHSICSGEDGCGLLISNRIQGSSQEQVVCDRLDEITVKATINAALLLRSRGADFGELNALIDSFA